MNSIESNILKESAIKHKNEMDKVGYPENLKLLSYDDIDIKLALNSLSAIRMIDNYKYQRAAQALEINRKLASLIRDEYSLPRELNEQKLDIIYHEAFYFC